MKKYAYEEKKRIVYIRVKFHSFSVKYGWNTLVHKTT